MGYLYVKVIESKKVAVRNSFFVNYPFIRIVMGKDKKTTNFKPGVEWWDKIFTFKQVPKGEHQQIIIQARDKSIHVFGSDWLGEVQIDLDSEGLLDERVHQMWFKFGRGRKAHSRSPRGYVHLAFQYSMEPISGRPFSVAPVEKVLSFEEWLAANNTNWVSDSSQWGIDNSTEPAWPKNSDPLRQSAPARSRTSGLSPDEPRNHRVYSTEAVRSPPSDSINPDPSRHEQRKLSNTRQRSQTMPDVRSPSVIRKRREDTIKESSRSSSSDEEAASDSDEEPRTGTLIDLSFDAPSKPHESKTHKPKSILKNSRSAPNVAAAALPAVESNPDDTIEDKIEKIKRLSLATTPTPPPEGYEGFQVNSEPTFADWYKPKNPFLDMHDNFEPAMTKMN